MGSGGGTLAGVGLGQMLRPRGLEMKVFVELIAIMYKLLNV